MEHVTNLPKKLLSLQENEKLHTTRERSEFCLAELGMQSDRSKHNAGV